MIFLITRLTSSSGLFHNFPSKWSPCTRCRLTAFVTFSPAFLQSVTHIHTHTSIQLRAHSTEMCRGVKGEGSGLLGPFSSMSDEHGPSAQGPLSLTHKHTCLRPPQKCVRVSLLLALVVRFSFNVHTSDYSRLGYSHWFGSV